MDISINNRIKKLLCGMSAAFLAVPFFMFPVNADSYEGIAIDGDFSDWDGVVKYDVNDQLNAMNQCAMVWDGDWIYIYLDEVQQNSASWSGPNHNGNFNIKTDIGEVLMIAVHNNGSEGNIIEVTNPATDTYLSNTNGGVQVAYNSGYTTWGEPSLMEIAIPSSVLPQYSSTINFGYYLGEDIITDVADANGIIHDDPDDPDDPTPTSGPHNDGSGIVIDGDYYDWEYYPVSTVEYDTAGTLNDYADAKGSIYSSEGYAYVHCVANYFDKADTGYCHGAEFLEVTVLFDYSHTKLIAVELGDDGSLYWPSSDTRELSEGTHHYALFYFSDSRTSTNMNNISSLDHFLGEMYITVGDLHDETEFWFDVGALQEAGGIDQSFSGTIQVLFHRVGWKLFPTSGVSTGPAFVVALSTVAAGSYYTINRRKKGR